MTDRRSIFLFSLKISRSLHFNSLPLSTLFLVQLFHRLQFLFSTITLCSSCSPPSQFSRTPVHSTDAPFSCLPRAAIQFSPFVTSSHFHLSFVLWLLYLFPSPCHLLLSLTFLIQNSFPCDAIQNAINMSGKYPSHISLAKGILIFHFQNFYFYFVHYSQGTVSDPFLVSYQIGSKLNLLQHLLNLFLMTSANCLIYVFSVSTTLSHVYLVCSELHLICFICQNFALFASSGWNIFISSEEIVDLIRKCYLFCFADGIQDPRLTPLVQKSIELCPCHKCSQIRPKS